jgi:hypothetical protein
MEGINTHYLSISSTGIVILRAEIAIYDFK